MRTGLALLLLTGIGLGPLVPTLSSAQGFDPTPQLDQLEIVRLERDLLAIGAANGDARVRLELDESLLWSGAQGLVGAAITDRRFLVVAVGAGPWQELRFLRGEQPAASAGLGDRVVLVHSSRRVIGFGADGSLREYRFGPNERLEAVQVAEGVGVALTDRKALAFSSRTGGFFEIRIGLRERIESLDVRAELATIRTDRRLLVFRGLGAIWSERRRELSGS